MVACVHFGRLTGDFGSYDERQRDFIREVFAVGHVGQLSLLQQAHLLPLLSQRRSLLSKERRRAPGRVDGAENNFPYGEMLDKQGVKMVCRSTRLKGCNIPSGFPHQSPDCPPFNPGQLSGFQVGERLLETQAEFIVSLKERSGKE